MKRPKKHGWKNRQACPICGETQLYVEIYDEGVDLRCRSGHRWTV